MQFKEICFSIFSYNRGAYLSNCIRSIEKFCPEVQAQQVIIFDDQSDEPETVEVLEEMEKKYTVIYQINKITTNSRSGLYDNMNAALQYAYKQSYKYVFFIQEDIQFVRPLTDQFLEECMEIFTSDDNIVQIQPIFFKGTFTKREYNTFSKTLPHGYIGNPNNLTGIADIGLVKVGSLIEKKWVFASSEIDNMEVAQSLGWYYIKPKNPYMMYTPWPETYRYNSQTRQSKWLALVEKHYKTGCYSYKEMTPEKIQQMYNRPIEEFPIAEHYLEVEGDPGLKKPWNFISTKFYLMKSLVKHSKKLKLFWLIKCFYIWKLNKKGGKQNA